MQKRLIIFTPHGSQIEIMDVTFLHTIHCQPNTESVLRHFCAEYSGCGVIDFRAAVSAVINVSVCIEIVGICSGRNFWIHG